MSAKVSGKRRARESLHTSATGCVPSASPSVPERRRATRHVPARAKHPLPSASPSNSRRVAAAPMPARAIKLVPLAEIPNVGGAGHIPVARKGQDDDARASNLTSDLHLIRELYGQRRDLLGVQTGMTNRLKAIVKAKAGLAPDAMVSEELIRTTDYPPLTTLLQARGTVAEHIVSLEGAMTKCVVKMPAYAFWEGIRGLGPLGLALIIGEAGNLADYATHSKLWRRFGLHVGGGKAYYVKRAGMTGEAWEAAGYCPRRRSVVYQITDSLLKSQIRKDKADPTKRIALGPYGELYLARKAREHEKARAEGLIVRPAGKIPKADAHMYRSEGHIHNRAARYVGKKLLRDLWKNWKREATLGMPKGHLSRASRSPSIPAGRAIKRMPAMAETCLPSSPALP